MVVELVMFNCGRRQASYVRDGNEGQVFVFVVFGWVAELYIELCQA